MTDDIYTVEPITEDKIEALASAIDSVARERRYLAPVKGFPIESVQQFVKRVIDGKGVSLVALHDGAVIGWCDVVRPSFEGYQHSGRLGMRDPARLRGAHPDRR